MAIPRGLVRFRRDAVGLGLRDRIKQALTIVPVPTSSFNSKLDPIVLWSEEGEYLGVPRGFFNLRLRDTYIDEYQFVPAMGSNEVLPTRPITPRTGQGEIIEQAVAVIRSTSGFGGSIIEAKTAAGKTVMGLEVARRLGCKTLVIVHTSVLAEQWVGEIANFFPNWRVGKLQADKIDVKDKDIVIGMLQSCSLKDYPDWVYEDFGTVIIDEVHTTGAPEFGTVLKKFNPKYYLGLTGTLKRTDKAENVFLYGVGKVVEGMEEVEVLTPSIYFIDTNFAWDGSGAELDRQKPFFLRKVITSEVRNEIIVRQAVRAANAGRQVLILSERVNHVEFLTSQLKRLNIDVGMMVGASKKAERKDSQGAQVICATNKLVGVGFNEPRLDTLIFATPIQDVVQPVGRILRTMEGKKTPFVLDLVDSNSHIGSVLGMSRRKKYSAKCWPMFGEEVFEKIKKRMKER